MQQSKKKGSKIEKKFKNGDSKLLRTSKRLARKKLKALRILKRLYKLRMRRLTKLRSVLLNQIELQKKHKKIVKLHRQAVAHHQYRKELNRWLKHLNHQLAILKQIQHERRYVSRKLKVLKRRLRPRIKATQHSRMYKKQLKKIFDIWQNLHEELNKEKTKMKEMRRGGQQTKKASIRNVNVHDIGKIKSLIKALKSIKAKTKQGDVTNSSKFSVVKSKMWRSPIHKSVSEITLEPLIREQIRYNASHKRVEFNLKKVECRNERSMNSDTNLKKTKCREVYKVNSSSNLNRLQSNQKEKRWNRPALKALRSEAELLKARRVKKEDFISKFLFEEKKMQQEQTNSTNKRSKTDIMRRIRNKRKINIHHSLNSEEEIKKFELGIQNLHKDRSLSRRHHGVRSRDEMLQGTKAIIKKKKITKVHRKYLGSSSPDSISTNNSVRFVDMKPTNKFKSKQKRNLPNDPKIGVKEKNFSIIELYEDEPIEPKSTMTNKVDETYNNEIIKSPIVEKRKLGQKEKLKVKLSKHSLDHILKVSQSKLIGRENSTQFMELTEVYVDHTVEQTRPSTELEKLEIDSQQLTSSEDLIFSELTITSLDEAESSMDGPDSKVNSVSSKLSLKTKTQRQRFGLVQDIVGHKVSSRRSSGKDKMNVIKNNSFLKHVNRETDSASMNIKADHIWEQMRKSHNEMVNNNVGNEDIKKDLEKKYLNEVRNTLHNVLLPKKHGVAADQVLNAVSTFNSRNKSKNENNFREVGRILNPRVMYKNKVKSLKKSNVKAKSIPHGGSQGDFQRSPSTTFKSKLPNAVGDSITVQSSNTNLQSFTSQFIYDPELDVSNKEKQFSANRLSNAKRIFNLITSNDTPSNEHDLRLLDAYSRSPQKYNPILKEIYDSKSDEQRSYDQHIIDIKYDALMRRINLSQRRQTLRQSLSTDRFADYNLSGQSSSHCPSILKLEDSELYHTHWENLYANLKKSTVALRLDQQLELDRRMGKIIDETKLLEQKIKKKKNRDSFLQYLYSKPRKTSRQRKAETLYCAPPPSAGTISRPKNVDKLSSVCSLCGFRNSEISEVVPKQLQDKYWNDEQYQEIIPKLCVVCSDCGGVLVQKPESSKSKYPVILKSRDATIQKQHNFCAKCSQFRSEDSMKVIKSIPDYLRYQCRVLRLPIR